jgi:hypothetical protein
LKTTAEKSRIRKFLGLQDPDPSINKQKIKSTLISTVLCFEKKIFFVCTLKTTAERAGSYIFGPPRFGSFHQKAKNKKKLDFNCFVTSNNLEKNIFYFANLEKLFLFAP